MRGSAATADTPLIPARVGRYEILLPIASGGMATVYLARARGASGFEREVALKLTHTHLREEESFAHDLVEEAKLASRIRHPNVVSVNDVGDDPVGVYLVMDYIEGETLSGLLRLAGRTETPLPINVSLRVVVDALAGLHAAHELTDENGAPLGLVHRDFSPQNILVGLDGCPRLASPRPRRGSVTPRPGSSKARSTTCRRSRCAPTRSIVVATSGRPASWCGSSSRAGASTKT
jgi:serine/threonine-protein kinase